MADTPDVETLKRKGRRRLVGAIALVLVAVIVLPMVFDSEPKRAPPVSVRIPSEDDPAFTPKVVPKGPPLEAPKAEAKAAPKPEPVAPEAKAEPPKAEAKAEPKAAPKAEPKPEPKPEPKAEPKPDAKKADKPKADAKAAEAERKRAEAAIAGAATEQFLVPAGAFASAEKVQELVDKLKAEGLPHFTERITTSKGERTRVRVGPFPSKAAADKAVEQLKGMGLAPGKVVRRP